MHEGDALAMHVTLLPALPEHARAFLRVAGGGGGDVVHAQAEMVDASRGVLLEKLRDRRIRARGLHELDAGIRQLDVGEAHALLLVHLRCADLEAVHFFQTCRRRVQARHHDRDVRQSGDHVSPWWSAIGCWLLAVSQAPIANSQQLVVRLPSPRAAARYGRRKAPAPRSILPRYAVPAAAARAVSSLACRSCETEYRPS